MVTESGADATRYVKDLEQAVRALTVIVRDDYPDRYTIPQIAAQWGPSLGVSQEQIEALYRLAPLTE